MLASTLRKPPLSMTGPSAEGVSGAEGAGKSLSASVGLVGAPCERRPRMRLSSSRAHLLSLTSSAGLGPCWSRLAGREAAGPQRASPD
jgi:hypothetical protein